MYQHQPAAAGINGSAGVWRRSVACQHQHHQAAYQQRSMAYRLAAKRISGSGVTSEKLNGVSACKQKKTSAAYQRIVISESKPVININHRRRETASAQWQRSSRS